MLIPKQDKLRHRILGLLIIKKATKSGEVNELDFSLSVDELASQLKVSRQDIRNAVGLMIINKEVSYCKDVTGMLTT